MSFVQLLCPFVILAFGIRIRILVIGLLFVPASMHRNRIILLDINKYMQYGEIKYLSNNSYELLKLIKIGSFWFCFISIIKIIYIA